jgi:hypothetical protein
VFVEASEESVELAAGEAPVEGRGRLLEVVLEGEDARGELVEVAEVGWGEQLALRDREVRLDLVEPEAW